MTYSRDLPLGALLQLFLLVTNAQAAMQKTAPSQNPKKLKAKSSTDKFIPTTEELGVNSATSQDFPEPTHNRWILTSTARKPDDQLMTLSGLNTEGDVTHPEDEAHLYLDTERMVRCARSGEHSQKSKPSRPKPPRPSRPKPTRFPTRKPKPQKSRSYGTKPPLPKRPKPKPNTPEPYKGGPSVTAHYQLIASKGLIEIEVEPESQAFSGAALCIIMVRVPKGLSVLFEVLKRKNAFLSYSVENNLVFFRYDPAINELGLNHTSVFATYLHVVYVHVEIHFRNFKSHFVSLKFQVKARFHILRRSGLQVRFTSGFAGFVQTPHYERSLPIYVLRDAFVDVNIPSGHIIMVSFPWAEVDGCIKLKDATAKRSGHSTLISRKNRPPLKRLLPTLMSTTCTIPTTHCFTEIRRLRVSFTQAVICFASLKRDRKRSTGFRMWFSFHNKSSMPEQLSDGKWNCSVPYWPTFRSHLLCNFQAECSEKEDEVGCRYTTESCGPGYFQAGDACLFLERFPYQFNENIGWETSSNLCLRRGGRLASLKTKQRYKDARRILHLHNITMQYFFIGLRSVPSTYSLWYRGTYQWIDGTMAFHTYQEDQECETEQNVDECGHIRFNNMHMGICKNLHAPPYTAICERRTAHETSHSIALSEAVTWFSALAYVTCPSEHVTHMFLACDVRSDCFSQNYGTCSALMTPHPPSFQCRNLVQNVPFTLVCDHRSDCADSSDEDFCTFRDCGAGQFSCGKKCIPSHKFCDGWRDCEFSEDEMRCKVIMSKFRQRCFSPPALIDIGQKGMFIYKQMDNSSLTPNNTHAVCPETHFQCPNNGYCLPVFLRCNGVFDCTYHEDEADCDIYMCPGFFRCRASRVCVHQSHVCDGRPHCPQRDDELLCDLKCPVFCVCRGLAFFCTDIIRAAEYPTLRYLDAGSTNMTLDDLKNNQLLIFLSLAHCSITDLGEGHPFPNLINLDISDNYLTSIENALMNNLPRVTELFLSGNPMVHVFDNLQGQFPQVQVLDMSRVRIPQLNVSILTIFPNLRTLNLSHSGIDKVLGSGFRDLRELRILDLRGCPVVQFPAEMFQNLIYLENVHAQSFHICCPVVLPANFNLRKCIAPIVDVSSCENLLGSVVYKVSTYLFAFFALGANLAAIIYRKVTNKSKSNSGFKVFVTHLSLTNFLMGVYLVIVILADWIYNGIYMWNDISWRHSTICSMAGFLLMLSHETSALIMAVITFDRFLVLFFPFSRLQFDARSATSVSCIIWILSLLLNSVPLLPMTSHWQLYSQTGICIPLPITRTDFQGHVYFFSVLIVFNVILFIFISLGQLFIYCYTRVDGMLMSNTTQKNKDTAIARRFVTVAMSDCLCWFAIGLLGLLVSNGFPVSNQVNVAMAMFVMPLNSALNPFLYTANVILERRRCAHVEQLRKILMAQLSKKS